MEPRAVQETDRIIELLVEAIQERRRIRLVYHRKKAGGVTQHEIAPVDLRPGWTPGSADKLYLWAWCFAEGKPETHTLTRIVEVTELDAAFDPRELLAVWPKHEWPLPQEWVVPRDW